MRNMLLLDKPLTYNQANLKELHNQGLEVKVTTKDIKKKADFKWNSQRLRPSLHNVFFKCNPLFTFWTASWLSTNFGLFSRGKTSLTWSQSFHFNDIDPKVTGGLKTK